MSNPYGEGWDDCMNEINGTIYRHQLNGVFLTCGECGLPIKLGQQYKVTERFLVGFEDGTLFPVHNPYLVHIDCIDLESE